MKRKRMIKKIGAFMLAMAIALTGALAGVPVYASDLSESEETNLEPEAVPTTSGPVMRLASAGTGIQNGQHIYFGTYYSIRYKYKDPFGTTYPYWRVLDSEKANDGTSGMFLLSETLWGRNDSNEGVNYSVNASNVWDGSGAQYWCTVFYNDTFEQSEKSAIKVINVPGNDTSIRLYFHNWTTSRLQSNDTIDKVFFLSVSELSEKISNTTGNALIANYLGDEQNWWLRSKGDHSDNAGRVGSDGNVSPENVVNSYCARPAFNIDLSNVLFTSAASGGKSKTVNTGGVLNKVGTANVSDWKLTVKYSSATPGNIFTAKASRKGTVSAEAGKKLRITYRNAHSGISNIFVTAALCDTAGNILYYAPIKQILSGSESGGNADLTIPSDIVPGTYNLMILNEQLNGNEKTDYVFGEPVNIALTIPANISFNANGHGTAPAAQTVAINGKAVKPADPTASGWTFGGWYTDSKCTKAYDFSEPVTSDITLYAKWTKAATESEPSKPSKPSDPSKPADPTDPGSAETPKDPEQVNAFVERMYQNVLKRPSESEGRDKWSGELLSGKSCGSTLAQGFICSPEFTGQNVGDEEFVNTLYHTFFDREPDEEGKNYWLKGLAEGMSRTQVLAGFVNSVEFGNLCDKFGIARGTMLDDGSTLFNEGVRNFVLRNYTETLGRAGETAGVEDWSSRILKGELTMKDVAIQFLHSEEFLNKGLNDEEYVKVLYRTFMGRDYDDGGLKYWLGEIQTRGRDDIVNGFSDSQEFANIMAKYQQ